MLRPRNSDYRKCCSCGGPTSYWASLTPSPSVRIVCAQCGAYVLWLDASGCIIERAGRDRKEGSSVERLRERSSSSDEERSVRQSKNTNLLRQETNASINPLSDYTKKLDASASQSCFDYFDSSETINRREEDAPISFHKDDADASPLSRNRSNVVPFKRNNSLEPKRCDPGSVLSHFGDLVGMKSDPSDDDRRKLLHHATATRNKRRRDENQDCKLIRGSSAQAPLAKTLVTCPRCGTLFQVDRSGIPEGHQLIRCSRCEHQWHQRIS
jgi:predicted Zn finger-like uncharacterized protein